MSFETYPRPASLGQTPTTSSTPVTPGAMAGASAFFAGVGGVVGLIFGLVGSAAANARKETAENVMLGMTLVGAVAGTALGSYNVATNAAQKGITTT